jgi:hypothetical protein
MLHIRRSTRTSRAAALVVAGSLLTLTAGIATASPAGAKGKARVAQSSGTCTNGGHWKLMAKADNSGLELEFEVDINRKGQRWAVKLRDNGATVYSGSRTTSAPSGSFSVHRLITNRAGADVITATATRGSATCSGKVTY